MVYCLVRCKLAEYLKDFFGGPFPTGRAPYYHLRIRDTEFNRSVPPSCPGEPVGPPEIQTKEEENAIADELSGESSLRPKARGVWDHLGTV